MMLRGFEARRQQARQAVTGRVASALVVLWMLVSAPALADDAIAPVSEPRP